MKKIILTLAAALIGVAASAQVYVGGEVGFNRDTDDNQTSFTIMPEVGYTFNENIAVGAVLGYDYTYNSGLKDNTIMFSPYLRYTFLSLGPVNVFCDLNAGIYYEKVKEGDVSDDETNAFGYLRPGISLPLNDNLSFVAHLGSLGYDGGSKDFNCSLSGNDVTFGVYYSF
jgi:hypothetical protein